MPASLPSASPDDASGATQGLDLPDALALLRLQSGAVALTDAAGAVSWCNPAMQSLFGASLPWPGRRLALLLASNGADAAAVQDLFDAGPALPLRLTLADGRAFEMHLRGLSDARRVVSLCPAAGTAVPVDGAEDPAARLTEMLEMVQEFGQLGVWERNVRTLQGRWSRRVHELRGTPNVQGTPDFAASMRTIVDEDRARVEKAIRQSMRSAGRYEQRYRVRGADGAVRHLRSQWQVLDDADGRPERAIGVLRDDTEHWHLAQAHGEALEHLKLAVELAQIAVWRRDLRTNQVQMNDIGFRLLDLPARPEGLTLERLSELIHPDDAAQAQADVERLLSSGAPLDSELRVRGAAGHWRHFLTRRMVQRDDAGEPVAVFAVAMDMSERIASSRERIELVRQFEITAGVAGIGYWTMDTRTGIVRWSDQVYVMHGLPVRSSLPGFDTWAERHVHADDRAEVIARFSAWAEGALTELDIGFRIVRSDGVVRHLESHVRTADPLGHREIFGVMLDVTERHQVEAALRAASERSSLVTRGVGLGTWQMDDTGGAIWDEQMWRLRGLPARAQAPDREQRLALVHPQDREVVQQQLARTIELGQMTTLEFRVRWPDGEWHWLASRSMTVHDKASGRNHRIGVNWDITEARSAHLAHQERAAVLLESQAKSQFLSRMSHELRTPLNAVLGFTQLMLADGERASAATRKRRLEQIHTAGRHLLALIDDVLDLSSLEGGEMRVDAAPVALRPLVIETMALVERQARQMKLKLRHSGEAVTALADVTRLRQVLLNLLTNAVKYNVEGGSVTVHTAAEEPGVLLSVSDTGRGMSEAQLAHAFEPFNRLGLERGSIEGTGIGLSIVKALVARMHGQVHVRSTPGEGSVFEVRLPDASALPSVPMPLDEEPATRAAPGAPTRRARLLYIEDNAVNQLIVQELVALRPDLSLVCAESGCEGIEQALLQPDLILVDMHLPDIDGYEVLRRLRAHPATAHIRCIAVSANALPDDIARARQAGFADYWTKPLDFKIFIAALDDHFGPPA